MTDEIRIYHVDDPNDAPERRLSAFPTINPFIPRSLPQYVIPPVADSLYNVMQYYWYSAYQQGAFAAQKHQEQQQQQQQRNHHQQQQQQHQQRLIHQQQQQQLLQQQQQLLHHQTKQQLAPHPNYHHHHHQVASPSSSLGLTSSSSSTLSTSSSASTNLASSSCSSSSSVIAAPSSASSAGSSAASPVTSTTPASNPHHNNHQNQTQNSHQHIKKPLNPFMIYMQRQRPEIVKQGIIKESAAINQMLGQQWRKLSKEEQEPYYKLAEQEKILHAQKYPGWSARDNYANQKKKKKMKLKSISLNGLDQSDKKCRARFGLNNMASWCKPCRRKKKCAIANNRNYNHLT